MLGNRSERGATGFRSSFPVMVPFIENHVRQCIGIPAERVRDQRPVPPPLLPLGWDVIL
jgi:hypothetical protein